MKIKQQRFYLTLVVLLAVLYLVVGVSSDIISGIAGSPPGYTGAPIDGKTCATMTCHPYPADLINGWITTDIPSKGYYPSDTYNITVTATRSGSTRFGFQISSYNMLVPTGKLLLVDSVRTQFANSPYYITHTQNGTLGLNNTISWQLKWIAPSDTMLLSSTFFASFVVSDNGFGEKVYRTIHEVNLMLNDENEQKPEQKPFCIFPNPSNGQFSIRPLNANAKKTVIAIFSACGKAISGKQIFTADSENLQITMTNQKPGVYFLVLTIGKQIWIEKIIIDH